MNSQLENIYPLKRGRLAKDKDENFMLLNSDGQAYSINSAILLIWELCSGDCSVIELSKEIKANSKNLTSDPTEKVCKIIKRLTKAKLVEIKEIQH